MDREPDEIQALFLKTWADVSEPFQRQLTHLMLGISGETGELADMIKKHLYKPGRTATPEEVMDELSDVFYYVALMAWLWGYTIEDLILHLGVKLADGHGWKEVNHSGQG